MIEGWQAFEDSRRTDHPLITAQSWEEALSDAGFERALSSPEPNSPGAVLGQSVIVAKAPRTNLHRTFTAEAPAASAAMPYKSEVSPWTARLADAAAESETREILLDFVRTEIAAVLGLDSTASLDSRRRLIDLGLDSLMAVELRTRIARMLCLETPLPATLVFGHPTIEALAAYLYTSIYTRISGAKIDIEAVPRAVSSRFKVCRKRTRKRS